jgi:hypothetical protein
MWIVDLLSNTVAVHAQLAKGVSSAVRSYQRGDSIIPRQFSSLSIAVASILG